jgi:hypothetical protein
MPSARTILLVDLKEGLAVALADFGLQPVLRAANSVTLFDKMSHTLHSSGVMRAKPYAGLVKCGCGGIKVTGGDNGKIDAVEELRKSAAAAVARRDSAQARFREHETTHPVRAATA